MKKFKLTVPETIEAITPPPCENEQHSIDLTSIIKKENTGESENE